MQGQRPTYRTKKGDPGCWLKPGHGTCFKLQILFSVLLLSVFLFCGQRWQRTHCHPCGKKLSPFPWGGVASSGGDSLLLVWKMCSLSKGRPILSGSNVKREKEPRDSSISNEIGSWPEKEWGLAGDNHNPARNLLMGLKALDSPTQSSEPKPSRLQSRLECLKPPFGCWQDGG